MHTARKIAHLTFDKTKPIKVKAEDLRVLVETGRRAEAFDIAAELMRSIDALKGDIQEEQMKRVTAHSIKTLEYYKAVQDTYLQVLESVLKRKR
jgi:hypothetical protein